MKKQDTPLLPHSEEAEQIVLASLVIDNNLINEAIETITPKHFYGEKNKTIYKAIIGLAKEKKPVDLVILTDSLKGKIPATYLTEITSSIPTTGNFKHYLAILQGYYVRRLLIEESYHYIEEAGTDRDYSELLSEVVQRLSKIAQEQIKSDVITPKELAKIGGEDFANRLDNKLDYTGLSSGFSQLDRLCGGFGRGDLIIIAGQTNIGKSAFLLDVVYRECIKSGLACAYFSLEMNLYEIFYRLISKISFLESSNIKAPKYLKEPKRQKVLESIASLHNSKFFLDVTPVLTLPKLMAKAKKIKAKENIDFLCVDYIQLISTHSKNKARHEVLSEVTKDLKQLARELEIPVIAGAQLNRATIDDVEPRLSHIGESFAIVQHADTVVLISRNDTYATLNIAKARQAQGGKFDLKFDYKTVSFAEVDYDL